MTMVRPSTNSLLAQLLLASSFSPGRVKKKMQKMLKYDTAAGYSMTPGIE